MKIEPYKIEDNKWYNVSELVKLKMLPINNNRGYITSLIRKDLQGSNILETEVLQWEDGKRSTYRVRGEKYLHYVAIKGWNRV